MNRDVTIKARTSPEPEVQKPEPEVKKDKPKAVIETNKNGRPVIKVGTPVKAEGAATRTPVQKLTDTVMGASNAERVKRLDSVDPSPVTTKATGMLNRVINASGRAPGSADALLNRSASRAINVINKPGVTRELLERGGDIARAIAGGTKNSKNLRLAGAATLLSAAGYGIGKVTNRKSDVNNEELRASPDEDAALRQSLLNDG